MSGASSRVARLAATLPMLVMGAQASCLLSPPADYEEPQRTRPVLTPVLPATLEMNLYAPGDSIVFRLELQSVDAAPESPVLLNLYRNFGTDTQSPEGTARIIPPSLDFSERRDVSFDYTLDSNLEDACFQFTVVATHVDNISENGTWFDERDVSRLTWWVRVKRIDSTSTVDDCPTVGAQ